MPLSSNTTILNSFYAFVSIRFLTFFIVAVISTGAMLSSTANAHEIRPAIIDLMIQEDASYKIEIRLNLEAIIAKIGPEHSDTSESSNAEKYNILRSMSAVELHQEFERFKISFFNGINFSSDIERLYPALLDIKIPEVGDVELARLPEMGSSAR